MDERIVISQDPLNAETPLGRQTGPITPRGRHYVRDHFAIPEPPQALELDGLVERPFRITPDELRAMPATTLAVTLECAGNGRAFLEPPTPGEQWRLGAVGTAEWTGVPLADLLRRAGPRAEACEVVFRGADVGRPADRAEAIAFERSLPIDEARAGDALVAYAMDGEPLAPEHGAPLRLIVPGRYGMASVKWLARATCVAEPFRGYYQADRYVIDGRPLSAVAPRAVVVEPADGATVPAGRLAVRGYAWSGRGIAGVEVSTDGGDTWTAAALGDALSPFAWREWRHEVTVGKGAITLLAVAIAPDGERQPLEQRRNALGYMNNAARPVRIVVDARTLGCG